MAENRHKWVLEFYQRSRTAGRRSNHIVKWRKQENRQLQGWTGIHGNGLESALVSPWFQGFNFDGGGDLQEEPVLCHRPKCCWSLKRRPGRRWRRSGPGCHPTPTRWAGRIGDSLHDLQYCLVPTDLLGIKSIRMLFHFHLPNLRQNVSVAHAILELLRRKWKCSPAYLSWQNKN